MCKLCFVGPARVCWSCQAVRKSLTGLCNYCYAEPCKVALDVPELNDSSALKDATKSEPAGQQGAPKTKSFAHPLVQN